MEPALPVSLEVGQLGETVKIHHCPLCTTYSSRKRSSVIKHMRTHTGEKPFQCSFCDLRFSDSTAHRNHTRIHTGEKPFKCELCPYRGSRKSSVRSHFFHRHFNKRSWGEFNQAEGTALNQAEGIALNQAEGIALNQAERTALNQEGTSM